MAEGNVSLTDVVTPAIYCCHSINGFFVTHEHVPDLPASLSLPPHSKWAWLETRQPLSTALDSATLSLFFSITNDVVGCRRTPYSSRPGAWKISFCSCSFFFFCLVKKKGEEDITWASAPHVLTHVNGYYCDVHYAWCSQSVVNMMRILATVLCSV